MDSPVPNIRTLILVRHAHRSKKLGASYDNGLSSKGILQAQALGLGLKRALKGRPAAILTSPLKRCSQTAAIIARHCQARVKRLPLLTEGGQTGDPLKDRVITFCSNWLNDQEPCVIVCSHGDWIPLCLTHFLGYEIELKKGAWVELELNQTGIHLVRLVQDPIGQKDGVLLAKEQLTPIHGKEQISRVIKRIISTFSKDVDHDLTQAEEQLSQRKEAIHRIRLRVKRVRALICFLRKHLSPMQFAQIDTPLRDIKDLFTDLRDANVAHDLIQDLQRKAIDSKSMAQHNASDKAQLDRHLAAKPDFAALSKRAQALLELVAKARIEITAPTVDVLVSGIKRSYRHARAAARDTLKNCNTATLHRLRRRAKTLQYQLDLLTEFIPPKLWPYHQHLRDLNQHLGKNLDLALALRYLHEDTLVTNHDKRALADLIVGLRSKQQKKIKKDVAALFLTKPKRVLSSLQIRIQRAYLSTNRAEATYARSYSSTGIPPGKVGNF